MGNLRNVQRALKKVGSNARIISNKDELKDADAIIFPGVGAFGAAISNISPFKQVIYNKIESGVFLLGICLGLQLLFTESTEGGLHKGLNILKGKILQLPKGPKIPHIGWNILHIVDRKNPLVKDLTSNLYVYFAHSYYAKVDEERDMVAITNYGIDFPSIISKNNVFATQFHPEKSGKIGLRILQNFINHVKK